MRQASSLLLRSSRRKLDVYFPHTDPNSDFQLRHLPRTVDESHLLLPGRYRIVHSWGGAQRPTSRLGSPVSAVVPGFTIDKHLARYYLWEAVRELTRSHIPYQDYVAIVHAGGVRVNGRVVHPDDAHMPIRFKDRIELDFTMPLDYRRVHLPPSVVLEDGPHSCIASKPIGLPLGNTSRKDALYDVVDERETMIHQVRDILFAQRVEDHVRCRTRTVMRTSESGLVLFTRSKQFWEASDISAEYTRTLARSFLVVAENNSVSGEWAFDDDEVDLYDRFSIVSMNDAVNNPNQGRRLALKYRYVPHPEGEPIVTVVRKLATFGRLTLLSVTPRVWGSKKGLGAEVWRRQLELHGLPVWNSVENLRPGRRRLVFDPVSARRGGGPANGWAGGLDALDTPRGGVGPGDSAEGEDGTASAGVEALPQYGPVISQRAIVSAPEYVHAYRIQWAPIGTVAGNDVAQGPPVEWSVGVDEVVGGCDGVCVVAAWS